MESRKEAEISNALFDMLDDPFNAKLPDLAVVNLYKLAKDRRIWLDIAVDDNTLEWEKQILLWNMEDHGVPAAQRKPIWIYLFNYGGSFDMEWSFIDLIDASATPIYTVNMGVCASAAADIFIAGKKRFMTKNARTMLHQGSAGFQGDSQMVNVLPKTHRNCAPIWIPTWNLFLSGSAASINTLPKQRSFSKWLALPTCMLGITRRSLRKFLLRLSNRC